VSNLAKMARAEYAYSAAAVGCKFRLDKTPHMKKLALLALLFLMIHHSSGQTHEHRWNIGLHGGALQYRGDLGNGFYRFGKAFYGHAGLSLNRYLNRNWDASFLATRGVIGYLGDWNKDPTVATHFLTNMTTFNLLARYNFVGQEYWVQPYLTGGFSALQQSGSSETYAKRGKGLDYSVPIGAGLKIQFGDYIGLQVQELLYLNTFDDIDFQIAGAMDLYLLHSVALTFNLGKLGKLGAEQPQGVGNKIDKCPKVKQYRNKMRGDEKIESKSKSKKSKKAG